MSETRITNLNSTLIDICHQYQCIVRDLQGVMQKIYESKEPDEVNQLILDAHAKYIVKLKKVDDLIQAVRVELNLTELDLVKLKTIH